MTKLYSHAMAHLVARKHDDKGAVAVEYALIIGAIAIALIGALVLFVPQLRDFVSGFSFTDVGSE